MAWTSIPAAAACLTNDEYELYGCSRSSLTYSQFKFFSQNQEFPDCFELLMGFPNICASYDRVPCNDPHRARDRLPVQDWDRGPVM